ncbi:FkbM family methyltransferase [Prosthecobacter fusiformis]|uniref:FkbM family methyltransferase n=2 Tax=Prosthecobacter fusiformis TaxID=48464 RepID=A0A4R7RLJ3_9BACT|nr:FkbM family methyltransferase [Prosthecobacter fusiformis]
MPLQWMRWCLRWLGIMPSVRFGDGNLVCNFRNFSEYRSVLSMIPPTSETSYISANAGSTGIILDVGANIGCMSLTLSDLRPNCIVYAFEPSPETFKHLKSNVSNNKASDRVIPLRLAVGREDTILQFLNDSGSPATNRLILPGEHLSGPLVEVNVVSLDSFLVDKRGPEVAFLKIDVEGHEPAVIQGAIQLLSSGTCRSGLVELCPANLHRVGYTVEDLLCSVESAGWCLRHLNNVGIPCSIVSLESASLVTLENVALLPKCIE